MTRYTDAMRSVATALVLLAWPGALHAQTRPGVHHPWHAYLVEGRVFSSSGAPAAGVTVERMEDATGTATYADGVYRATTDATGAFRFEHAGLGPSAGSTWYLAVRRAGCADARITVTLEREPISPGEREGDVARGVVMRLPACP